MPLTASCGWARAPERICDLDKRRVQAGWLVTSAFLTVCGTGPSPRPSASVWFPSCRNETQHHCLCASRPAPCALIRWLMPRQNKLSAADDGQQIQDPVSALYFFFCNLFPFLRPLPQCMGTHTPASAIVHARLHVVVSDCRNLDTRFVRCADVRGHRQVVKARHRQ
jgi:hypothetical protein